jgi:hypothetical protein
VGRIFGVSGELSQSDVSGLILFPHHSWGSDPVVNGDIEGVKMDCVDVLCKPLPSVIAITVIDLKTSFKNKILDTQMEHILEGRIGSGSDSQSLYFAADYQLSLSPSIYFGHC